MPDALQPELLRIYILNLNPHCILGIVHCPYLVVFFYFAQVKHVHCVHCEPTVQISVWNREQEFFTLYLQSGFLHHFASDSLFACFPQVAESTREVKRSLCRFLCTSDDKQFTFFRPVVSPQYERHSSGAGVDVIHESAVLTSFTLPIPFREPR